MKIIGMSLTHNDLSRKWLNEWLLENSVNFDEWVILDDCSDDGTFKYISDLELSCAKHLFKTDAPLFVKNENSIRSLLWEKVREIAKPGDWIVPIDSDEIICHEFKEKIADVIELGPNNLIFRKIEMWDDKNYNVLGLWSNYFVRMFPFVNVDWGRDESGYHISSVPSKIIDMFELRNVNIRIKHLAYQSEGLRQEKYNFMMSSPQQNKNDVNFYHLQSLKSKPVLKEFCEKQQLPEVNLFVFCINSFRIPQKTIEFLKKKKYGGKINVFFLVSNCHYGLMDQIYNIQNDISINCSIVKFADENFFNKVNDRKERSRLVVFDKFKNELSLSNFSFFVDAEFPIDENLIEYYSTMDRGVVLDNSCKMLLLSKRAVKFIYEHNAVNKIASQHFLNLVDFFCDNNILCWLGAMNKELSLLTKKDC